MGTTLVQLQKLTARHCPNISFSQVHGFDSLRELDLAGCDAFTSTASAPALRSFSALQRVCLDGCTTMTSLQMLSRSLRSVSACNCPTLAMVDVRSSDMTDLRLGPSPAHAHALYPLKHLVLQSGQMKAACFSGFSQLDSLDLHMSHMTRLELCNCPALTDAVWPSLCADAPPLAACQPDRLGIPPRTRAGCRNLRVVMLENCERLVHGNIKGHSLHSLTISGCSSLQSLDLDTHSLNHLQLDDCDALTSLRIERSHSLADLMLGNLHHLNSLYLHAHSLQHLNLKGCGHLRHIDAECGTLQSIDATFCGQLEGSGLARLIQGASFRIRTLLLSVCGSVSPSALSCLSYAHRLQTLDLSYTEIEDIGPLLDSCTELRNLNLSSCRSLRPDALQALMNPVQIPLADKLEPASSVSPQVCRAPQLSADDRLPTTYSLQWPPLLHSLDVSYCPLPAQELDIVLQKADSLQTLAMNGCSGVTAAMWAGVNGLQKQHALQTLSCVGCKSLRCCWLGLVPARPADDHAQELLMSVSTYTPVVPSATKWKAVPTALAGLKTLRLGLSGVRTVALQLPELVMLDVNGAAELRCLELRCPRLLTAFFSACRALPGLVLEEQLAGCRYLERVDLQHISASTETIAHLRMHCPSIYLLLGKSEP